MPKYAPHTLPADGARASAPSAQQKETPAQQQQLAVQAPRSHPAVLLGQHIRRERGMQGVRGYAAAIRDYLNEQEYKELCAAMGVQPDARVSAPPPQAQQTVQQPAPVQQPQQHSNPANQLQMMQTLAQLMPLLSGGGGTQGNQGGGGDLGGMLGQLMGGGQGGGINPAMLSSLLGGGQAPAVNAGGGAGGLNPMMLAQLLGGLQK